MLPVVYGVSLHGINNGRTCLSVHPDGNTTTLPLPTEPVTLTGLIALAQTLPMLPTRDSYRLRDHHARNDNLRRALRPITTPSRGPHGDQRA